MILPLPYLIVIGDNGEVYIAGRTDNEELVFGENIHQSYLSGEDDLYLAKFTSEGQLAWCTYFGGPGMEFLGSLSLSAEGNPILTGATNSEEGIVFAEAYQEEKAFGGDTFIAVFTQNGVLEASTYFGGNHNDSNIHSDVDSDGNIFLGGRTYSTDLSTADAHQETNSNPELLEGFVARFSPDLNLTWCTYLGSTGDDFVVSLATDGENNSVIALNTDSNTGLATEGAPMEAGQNKSPVIAKFSEEGNLLWATYLPGEDDETFSKITVNNENEIFISGWTSSFTGIATENAFQEENIPGNTWPGGSSAYIMKLNPEGETVWGTYFGGLYSWFIDDLVETSNGLLIIHDNSVEEDLIYGSQPFQISVEGERDVFISKFSDEGDMIWSTAFGGEENEDAGAVSVFNNKIAVVGNTSSLNFYGNSSSWQEEYGGGPSDLFIALFQDNVLSQTNIYGESSELTAYPNPSVSGQFKLDWKLENLERADLTIYDLYGREIQNIRGYQRNAELNLNLSNGIYFVGLKYRGTIHTKKVLILR